MAKHLPKKALLISGPTASGKSALAQKFANEQNGVIINADAMQVYRELRILTARPTAEEESAVPHRLYGHVDARQGYSAAQWLSEARQQLNACWQEGLLPIIVGGTGLYFKLLEEGLADLPAIPPDIRKKWREFPGDLHCELMKRSSASAARLNSSDRQRLIRELEVLDATDKPLSHWQARSQGEAVLTGVETTKLYIQVDRSELYGRAERRLDAMIKRGAVAEVEALLKLDLPPSLPITKAIGVPELSDYLRGDCPLEEAVIQAKTATRHYIKRQLTWWRGQMTGWTEVLS